MYVDPELDGALCADPDADKQLWDLDAHRHRSLPRHGGCWMCDEAEDLCNQCPVVSACFQAARRNRESYMIWAGHAWSHGRPVSLKKRRAHT